MEAYWSRWPGLRCYGDWASVDESFNVAGRKVGPAEVEACLIGHAAVDGAHVPATRHPRGSEVA